MESRIEGGSLPVVICNLEANEQIVSENGAMSWMDDNIRMETTTNGGIMKGIGRAFAGESVFMNQYTAENRSGEIAFSSCFPGRIIELDLQVGQSIIAQKKALICAAKSVDISINFRKKLGVGFFGGEGFIMLKLTGPGKVFLEIDGAAIKKELAPGQKLKLDNGYLAAMTESVDMNIEMVKGLKNILLGGEGLTVTTVTGPGTVWLQSMPISKLTTLLMSGMPSNKS